MSLTGFLDEVGRSREAPQGAHTSQKYNVGIRFQPVGEDRLTEDKIDIRHWALVLTPASTPSWTSWSFQMELTTEKPNIFFLFRIFDYEVKAFPLGTWNGKLNDIHEMIRNHPMRYSTYDIVWNNCQHWAATMVISVLNTDGDKIFHDSCILFGAAHLMGLGADGVIARAGAVAAEATTAVTMTMTVPASGIAGFFGATTTAVVPIGAVPTAGAAVGMVAVPLGFIGAAATGSAYAVQRSEWKSKTIFKYPRLT